MEEVVKSIFSVTVYLVILLIYVFLIAKIIPKYCLKISGDSNYTLGRGLKKFVYPDAFENFMTLADGTISEEILEDIRRVKEARQIIIDRKNEENVRAMTRGIVIPGKEIGLPENEENI